MIDSLLQLLPAARATRAVERLGLRAGGYVLVTLHRPSLVDEPARLAAVLDVLDTAAAQLPVVFPVHPRTRARLDDAGLAPRAVRLLEPLDYLDFIALEADARLVVTDSGGLQEETSALGVPCLTFRTTTERAGHLRARHEPRRRHRPGRARRGDRGRARRAAPPRAGPDPALGRARRPACGGGGGGPGAAPCGRGGGPGRVAPRRERRRHHAVRAGRPRGRPARPARAAAADALARAGDGRRLVPGRAAGLPAAALRALGRRLRLARDRGAAQRGAPVPHRARRPRHPLPARPLAASRGAAARPHARLARLGRRVRARARTARRPSGARRGRRRRLPRRLPVAPGLRLQRPAGEHRLGRRAHRPGVERAHGAAGLRPLRRRRQRLGHEHLRQHRPAAIPSTSPAST